MTAGAFFDVDGTLIDGHLAALAGWDWMRRGFINPARFARGAVWFWGNYLVGRMNYGDLTRVGFLLLAGKSARSIEDDARDIFERRVRDKVYARALEQIRNHRDAGHQVALASSAPAPMVRALADSIGVKDVIITELETREDILTGRVVGDLCYGEGKRKLVEAFAERYGVTLSDSFAYADGYPDVAFLAAVGHPVAVNPDRRLLREARRRGWEVTRFQ